MQMNMAERAIVNRTGIHKDSEVSTSDIRQIIPTEWGMLIIFNDDSRISAVCTIRGELEYSTPPDYKYAGRHGKQLSELRREAELNVCS